MSAKTAPNFGIFVAALLAVLPSLAAPLRAQIGAPSTDTFKASNLHDFCTMAAHTRDETVQTIAEATCTVYLRGLTDGLFMMQILASKQRAACFPITAAIDVSEARRLFELWLASHPDQSVNSAAVVAFTALASAYPCK